MGISHLKQKNCCVQVSADTSVPLDLAHAWNQAGTCLKDTKGSGATFVISYESGAYYLTPPGSYVIIPFTDAQGQEKNYALTLGTTRECSINVE